MFALAAGLFLTPFLHAAQLEAWNEAKIFASDGEQEDKLGRSVSLSGDRALVGAPEDVVSGLLRAGSAYVYRFDPNSAQWLEEAKLIPADSWSLDTFGHSVSIDGDCALIGSPHDDDNGNRSGSAYVFRFDPLSGTWEEEAKLLASDGARYDNFGWSVSLSGDRALVGAHFDDDNGMSSGSAYLFHYSESTGTWQEEAKILPTDGQPSDEFGRALSLSGNRALIGAAGYSVVSAIPGAAYVFRYDPGTAGWQQEAKLLANDGEVADQFGSAVFIDQERALVGAYLEDDNGSGSGAAYVYRFETGSATWLEEAKLMASDGMDADFFGHSVAIDGDVAVVGGYGDDDRGVDSGSVYLFRLDPASSEWKEKAKMLANDGVDRDFFGRSVAVENGRVLIGAPGTDDLGFDAGSGYFLTPFLSSSSSRVSAVDGLTLDLVLDFPVSESGRPYSVLGSAAGTGPTHLLGQLFVPLTSDVYFRRALNGMPPRNFRAAYGLLDANGDARARWHIIPGGASRRIGQTVWTAAVSWDSTGPRLSSQAVPLFVEP